MIKKILYLITAVNIFSLTEYEKEILKKIENTSYSCDVENEKVTKIKGKDFVGHINEKGEFYGEINFPKEDNIRYCFLKDEYKVYLKKKDGLYLKNVKFNDEIFKYGNELYQYINPEGNVIVFEKKNDKFERIGGVIVQVPTSYKLRGNRKSEDFFKYNKLEIKEEEIE